MAASRRLKEALALDVNKVPGKSSSQSTCPENEQRIKSIFNICKKTAFIFANYSCYFVLKDWLKSELKLLDTIKEAELTLESLIESRTKLAAQQTTLQSKLEAPDNSPTFIDSVQKELAGVSADMDLRSTQIMELNKNMDSCDLEAKAGMRMEYLETMVEAKVC